MSKSHEKSEEIHENVEVTRQSQPGLLLDFVINQKPQQVAMVSSVDIDPKTNTTQYEATGK